MKRCKEDFLYKKVHVILFSVYKKDTRCYTQHSKKVIVKKYPNATLLFTNHECLLFTNRFKS